MYTQPIHMPAAMLNAFHNVWLRNVTNNSALSITVNNHPLPSTTVSQVWRTLLSYRVIDHVVALFMQIRQLEETNGVFTGVLVVGGYSFLLASFVVFIVGEKESKVCASTTLMYMFMSVYGQQLHLCRRNTFSLLVVCMQQATGCLLHSGTHSMPWSLSWLLH